MLIQGLFFFLFLNFHAFSAQKCVDLLKINFKEQSSLAQNQAKAHVFNKDFQVLSSLIKLEGLTTELEILDFYSTEEPFVLEIERVEVDEWGQNRKVVLSLDQNFLEMASRRIFLIGLAHEFGHFVSPDGLPVPDLEDFHGVRFYGEGEADYQAGVLFSTRVRGNKELSDLILKDFQRPEDLEVEARVRRSLQDVPRADDFDVKSLTSFYIFFREIQDCFLTEAEKRDLDPESKDESVTSETFHDYPSLQARYDTFKAGLLSLERPASWAHPRDFLESFKEESLEEKPASLLEEK